MCRSLCQKKLRSGLGNEQQQKINTLVNAIERRKNRDLKEKWKSKAGQAV